MRESFVTMKTVFRLSTCALAVALLTISAGSHALSLGRARGAAFVAQPLNVSITVSASADEEVSDLCFDADVFYGESKVETSKVSVSSDTPLAGQSWQVRVVSRLPVDEPVVTVYLRSSCSGKASRRYVLLADVAPDSNLPLQLPSSTAALPPFSKSSSQEPKKVASPSEDPGNLVPSRTSKKARDPLASVKPPTTSSESAQLPKTKTGSKSRLKLAPLDLTIERDPTLSSSPELLSTPTDDPQKRGEAIALWKSLNLTPEDVMRDAARLQGLEATVSQLGDASKLNQREIAELKAGLERSDRERYNNPLVFTLGAALVIVVAGGIWLYRRQHQAGASSAAWWRGSSDVPMANDVVVEPHGGASETNVVVPPAATVERTEGLVGTPDPSPIEVDIDLGLEDIAPEVPKNSTGLTSPYSGDSKPSVRSSSMGLRDFIPSMAGSLRAMNTQEMLDIRQQAEFFVTLGQYDEAIRLLENHIAEGTDASPAVYLDLLKIFHALSRKEAFDKYRAEFNAIFTGEVSEYKDFTKPGQGLEVYPELCDHLTKLWPSKEALEFMEDCLVRKPDAAATMQFELEAFKELLMLHGIATRLVNALDGTPVAFSANKPVAPSASVFYTGPSPLDVSLPVNASAPIEVDFELDIPTPAPELKQEIAAPSDNLIDFDASGLTFKNGAGKSRT